MASKDDEQKHIQEYRELLKLKQGLIEESEVIPQDGYVEIPKPQGTKKIENFFYHYKWRVLAIAFLVIVFGFLLVQCVTREKADLNVAVISTTVESGIYAKLTDIEETLEKYCPDFDGNGYVHVSVNYIDLNTSGGYSEYTDAQQQKLFIQLYGGDCQMFLCDDGILDIINEIAEGEFEFFYDFSEEYPDTDFTDGNGLQLNTTEFTDLARWSTCPDFVSVYVRGVFEDMTANDKEDQQQRERALEVFGNILNGNAVNSDE